MGFGLTLRIDARALVLDEVAGLLDTAVVPQRHHADTAAAVIGGQDEAPGSVDGKVTGAAAGRGAVEDLELEGVLIEGERGDRPVTGFDHGVEDGPVRVQGEKARVLHARDRAHGFEGPGVHVETVPMDALTLDFAVAAGEKHHTRILSIGPV